MFAYYLERGHTLTELLNLSLLEKVFYMAAMEAVNEEMNTIGQ